MKLLNFNDRYPLLTLLIGGLLVSCTADHSPPSTTPEPPQKVTVKALSVQESAPLRQIEVMGSVQAADRAVLASRISGTITELNVQRGSRVTQGDQLIRLRADEIAARVRQATAQLKQAERNLARERKLLQKNAATQETVSALEEARDIAAASYSEAKTILSYTTIKAPFGGVITDQPGGLGDLATPGKPLLYLASDKRLEIITAIPESLVLGLQRGDTLAVFIPAAELQVDGVITEIAPATDLHSRTTPVTLAIAPHNNIRPGQFARVSLPGSRGTAIMIPQQGVSRFGQLERVFLIDQKRVRLQLVKTGLIINQQVEIVSGLSAGDTIAIPISADILVDGQPVSLQK